MLPKMFIRLKKIRLSLKLMVKIGIVFCILTTMRFMISGKRALRIHNSGSIFKPVLPFNHGRGVYIETLDEKDKAFQPAGTRDRKPRILFTPYKNVVTWKLWNSDCMKSCPVQCDITYNMSDIKNVDAVNFYLVKLWPDVWAIDSTETIQFPSYRRQDQVWILSNFEPPSNLFGDIRVFNGMFNWTDWYRTDATIFRPYGRYEEKRLSENGDDKLKLPERNIYKEKSHEIIGVISNCKDASRRYRFVDELSKHLKIDMYGHCYHNICGVEGNYTTCDHITTQYKFYLGLENTYCKDYVTEKYWGALDRNQIPIVNWDVKNINKNIPIPGSYISVHDFGSIKELAAYIKKVSANETLYNSYFDWKKKYTPRRLECATCPICKKLHERMRPQVLKDLDGWVRDDVCEKVDKQNFKDTSYSEYLFWQLGI